MNYKVADMPKNDRAIITQAADLLVEGFGKSWPDAWPDRESALQEVEQSLQPDRISRIAVAQSGPVLGWIGGIRQYDGNVWELHPLVVENAYRKRGIGSALVRDLIEQVARRGGLTIWLGSDDESGMTSLSGVNLFPGVLKRLETIKNLRGHPYTFYQKLGFEITGIMPDANGPGKPDIYMARPVRQGDDL